MSTRPRGVNKPQGPACHSPIWTPTKPGHTPPNSSNCWRSLRCKTLPAVASTESVSSVFIWLLWPLHLDTPPINQYHIRHQSYCPPPLVLWHEKQLAGGVCEMGVFVSFSLLYQVSLCELLALSMARHPGRVGVVSG